MSSAALVKDFNETFEFTPIKGRANEYVINSSIPHRNAYVKKEMSPADWDKFEKDIEDAFEQVS